MSATVTIGSVTYTLTSGSYTASVTGNALEERTNVTIPSTITDPDTELPYTVTSIGNQAFNNSPYLASIVIPETVTIIANGSSPYYGAFMYCSALTAVTIGANVTSIGEGAFQDCSKLTAVTIPDAVTSIGYVAFARCSELTAVIIGSSVTTIGHEAFIGCRALTAVIIPDAVTSIGINTFTGCIELTAVTIGANVTSIGDYAFQNCSALTAVTIGSGNTSFFNWSNGEVYQISGSTVSLFFCPRNVTSFTIPDSVTDNVSYTVTSIGYSAFDRCTALTAVTIGSNVTSIGTFAFNGCSALTAVIIPNAVTTIGDGAFANCSKLTAVIIPDAVTSIGNNAFGGCSELTAVTIGANVTSIGFGAFAFCTVLTSMYFLGDLPTSLGSDLFFNDNLLTLYYLDGATGWYTPVGRRPAYLIPTITSATTSSVSISADSALSTVYVYTSTNSGFTWTTNSVTMSNGYGSLSNLSYGTLVSTIANIYDAAYTNYCKTVTNSTPTPSGNVCFPAKTPIITNCGPINIEDIDPAVHTIRNKKIVAITKTVAHDKNLVRIAKHALGHLYPEKTTFISQNHKVFFQGQMVQAKYLVDEARGVTLVPYNGQVLYNVLLEQYEKMQVNNLIVETLHPENKVAKLYRFLQNIDAAHHGKLIALFNQKHLEQRLRR